MSQDVHDKLDAITETLTTMQIDIAEIRRDIEHHIRRTDLAEKHIEFLEDDIRPIKRHVAGVETLVKSVAVLGSLLGIMKLVGVL
jgi:hypothetical protein